MALLVLGELGRATNPLINVGLTDCGYSLVMANQIRSRKKLLPNPLSPVSTLSRDPNERSICLKGPTLDRDCDCAGLATAEPTIPDICIVASTDILAVDQASIDLVYERPVSDNHDLFARIESRHGLHQLTYMAELKMGSPAYDLINIDDE